jgi:hypothetical protein
MRLDGWSVAFKHQTRGLIDRASLSDLDTKADRRRVTQTLDTGTDQGVILSGDTQGRSVE